MCIRDRGTMFDIGRQARVRIGDFTLVNGARFVSDSSIDVGDYTLISWNVILMDTYRASRASRIRRSDLIELPERTPRRTEFSDAARPISIGSNVWIGFD